MLLLLETAELLIDLTNLVRFDLILLELDLTLFLLFEALVFPVLHLCLSITRQVLLSGRHRLFDVLDTAHFFIELTLDLLEDSYALTVRCVGLLDLGEDHTQLVAEVDEILVNLSNSIERDDLLTVVSDRHDEAKTVALVEEALDFVPVAEEVHHLAEGGELDIGEEVFALLQDADRQSLLDEGRILGEVRHDLAGLAQGLAALLGDLEGGLLKLDQLVERGHVRVALDVVDVLEEDLRDQRRMRRHTFNLQHLSHLKDLTGDSHGVLKLLAHLLREVVRREALEVRESVVQSGRKGAEYKLTRQLGLLFVGHLGVLHDD